MNRRIDLEWGPQGLRTLSETCGAVVIIDVLSFSTSVTIAVARGAMVWPHGGSERAEELARAIGATLARGRNTREGRTLSPASLLDIAAGERLVMPSANGSALSYASVVSGLAIVAGSLRNADAVASWLVAGDHDVGLVPAGEMWPDHSLRVSYEDMVGAGAIAARMLVHDPTARLSPEAAAAVAAFEDRRPFADTPSGRELVHWGFPEDVALAEELDADPVVPVLRDGRYVAAP
ncbi:MAG: 2-phosphosulfolactate phosphatase [Actinomycetes bacterium]